MLKVVFVLGCLLCLTLAYSVDSASNLVERSPGRHHPNRGHGPSHGNNNRPCIDEKELQRILQILLNTAAATTTTAATTSAATTTTAATTTAATTATVAAT
ncbi:hypothetical protein GOODEAATRI_029472 [Goodea atripinnis]|uniref:Uncharacterized protein n=1 Tax=Goodea atripinnis TaxID=208336 RepID=A0ABV0P8U2_9TELE